MSVQCAMTDISSQGPKEEVL